MQLRAVHLGPPTRCGLFDNDCLAFDFFRPPSTKVLLALEHLHKHCVIYRDLKPENVLLDSQGKTSTTQFVKHNGVERRLRP